MLMELEDELAGGFGWEQALSGIAGQVAGGFAGGIGAGASKKLFG